MKNRKAAMEMSMGTIVTIILLVSVLILGIFLVQKIFASAKGAVDMTDEAITNEINKLFSEEKKLSIYPATQKVELKIESEGEVGIVMRNLIKGAVTTEDFSYDVTVSDQANCRESLDIIATWMIKGSTWAGSIATGESTVRRVSFLVPTGTSLCSPRFEVVMRRSDTGQVYSSTFFDITITA